MSLLMATSSQMIHSLLPVFLVTVLGASAISVGLIEGIAEATNSLARLLSGAFSDWLGRRKPLVVSLLASSGAGILWALGGSAPTFGVGAALSAAVLLMLLRSRRAGVL